MLIYVKVKKKLRKTCALNECNSISCNHKKTIIKFLSCLIQLPTEYKCVQWNLLQFMIDTLKVPKTLLKRNYFARHYVGLQDIEGKVIFVSMLIRESGQPSHVTGFSLSPDWQRELCKKSRSRTKVKQNQCNHILSTLNCSILACPVFNYI